MKNKKLNQPKSLVTDEQAIALDLFKSIKSNYQKYCELFDDICEEIFESDSYKEVEDKFWSILEDWWMDDEDGLNYVELSPAILSNIFWKRYQTEMLPFDLLIYYSMESIICSLTQYKVKSIEVFHDKFFNRYNLLIFFYENKKDFDKGAISVTLVFSNHQKEVVDYLKDTLDKWVKTNKFEGITIDNYQDEYDSIDDIEIIHKDLIDIIDPTNYYYSNFGYPFHKNFFDNEFDE